MKYYGVRKGRNTGIYNTWDECSKEVTGFKGAAYKKFTSYDEALNFINERETTSLDAKEEINENEVIAYVDGSFCAKTNTYSYGLVFITNEGKETYNGYGNDMDMAQMRNVTGELMGAVEAIKLAIDRNKNRLYLHYDYAGIEKWAKSEWKTNKKGTQMYKKFYDSIKDELDVEFIKVKAHSGVEHNEEADQLAKDAIEKLGIN